jgi:hypothetical protein
MKTFLFLFVASQLLILSQTDVFINANNLYVPISNNGVIAQTEVDPFKDGVRIDSIKVMFSGGFMLSGYSGDSLFARAMARTAVLEDFQAGLMGSDPSNILNIIYGVKRTDEPFGETWGNWTHAVNQGAYFYDGDSDGIYDPIDKNSNGIWDNNEDKPYLIYDETYFCVYNDAGELVHAFPEQSAKGIEIRQYVFVSSQNSLLSNTFFVRYSLLNKGNVSDTLNQVIFSVWTDNDIGQDYIDDLVGCDTSLSSVYTYKDQFSNDPLFGPNPAPVFTTLLQGPISYTGKDSDTGTNKLGPELGLEEYGGYKNLGMISHVHNQSSDPDLGFPRTAIELRNYQYGKDKHGTTIDPCDWVLGNNPENCESINPTFWYSGDPVSNLGWLNITHSDQSQILNTGPFDLIKDEPVDIIVAYSVERGTDALNSITKTRETVQYVLEEYERNFSTIVSVENEPEEIVNEFSLLQNYPNPFNPTTTIKFSIPSVETIRRVVSTKLIVYDILGREISTLVNEVKAPGTYEVQFDASNLTSGIYFYRLIAGDFVQTRKMILLR